MHPLLQRQVRKYFGDPDGLPEEVKRLIDAVDAAYEAADEDRKLLERSMDLTSKELLERNEELEKQVVRAKEARDALRKSEKDYRLIVETATEGIWLLGPDNKTKFINDRMAKMLGYDRDRLLAMTPLDVIVGDRKEDAMKAFQQLDENMSGDRDVQMRRRDGTKIWVSVSSQAVFSEDDTYQGALGMVSDITARKQAEDALRQAFERLQGLESDRVAFINAAAHEMNTPLTPLKLQARILRDRVADDPTASRSMDLLDRNIERLGGLVKDLLDASRIQSGTLLQMDESPVDLAELAIDAVDGYADVAKENGVKVTLDAVDGMFVHCDANRISQVIDNLLSNALKFTHEGGTIEVKVCEHEGMPCVRVRDDGRGIDPTKLGDLFKPFSQVHDLDPDIPAGTGLGLHICTGIIEQSGGKIWGESKGRDKGAVFTFCIPYADDKRARVPAETDAPADGAVRTPADNPQ